MADTFEDLGIAPELAAGAYDMGWEAPSSLQRDAVPVMRRDNNIVLHAAPGAGVTGAYGLAVLDRVLAAERDDAADETAAADGNAAAGGDAGPRALILTTDSAAASSTAAILARLGAPAGVTVRALAPGWTRRATHVLVTSPAAARAAIGGSALKLDALLAIVVDGADRLREDGAWSETEVVLDAVPPGAQRVLVTGALPERIERLIERHVRKAMTIPARPADEAPQEVEPVSTVRYAVAPAAGKLDALVALLEAEAEEDVAIIARTHDRAETVGDALAERGLPVEGAATAEALEPAGDEGSRRILVLPLPEADQRSTRATVLSYDVPFDAALLAELHTRGGTIIATPGELQHLRLIATRAAVRLEPATLPTDHALDPAERARERIRAVLREQDLSAYLALIEPLLDESPAPEIAAAAAFLAGTAGAQPGTGAGAAAQGGEAGTRPAGAATRGAATAGGAAAGAPPPSTSYVRLFLSVGSRDGAGPGDILGSITGEAEVKGEEIGRIDIRESHSTVEVPTHLADRVIRALNGRTLRGRSIRVDYDRKDRDAGPGGGRRPSGSGRGSPPGAGGRPGGRQGGRPGSKPAGRPGGRPGGGRPRRGDG